MNERPRIDTTPIATDRHAVVVRQRVIDISHDRWLARVRAALLGAAQAPQ